MDDIERSRPPAYIIRVGYGGSVRAVLDPADPDTADWQHEPEWDTIASGCDLFLPGHHAHFIQVPISMENPPVPAEIITVHGPEVTGTVNGAKRMWLMHDPSALQLALMEAAGPVEAEIYGQGLLKYGTKVFNLCDNPEVWRPCRLSALSCA